MPLFEHMPYTNYQNANLDWLTTQVKKNETDIATIQTTIAGIEGQITTINTSITQIIEEIGEIDLSEIENRITTLEGEYTTLHNSLNNVTLRLVGDEEDITANTGNIATNTTDIATNNDASIARDNALAARIASLERAHLHDIYNYYSEGNMLLFGSDLRNLPDSCKSGGFPISYGNATNRHLYVGTTKTRAWKLTANGFQPNTASPDGYDYYQMGKFPASLGVADYVTVTFAVSTGGDATPNAWYKHTFQASNEQWEVATGCIVKFMQHTDDVNSDIYTVAFLGTPANWANVIDSSHYIPYIFVEWGTGSVSTEATDKCKFDIKDRMPFMEIAAPEYTPTITNKSKTFYGLAAEATWTDNQGFTHTVSVPVDMGVMVNSISNKWFSVGVLFTFDWSNNIDMVLNLNAFDIFFTGGLTWGENDSDDPFYGLNIGIDDPHLLYNVRTKAHLIGPYEYDLQHNMYINYAFCYDTTSSKKHRFSFHISSSGLDGSVETGTTQFQSSINYIASY